VKTSRPDGILEVALLATVGHSVRAFESAEAFLAACSPQWRGCLVLDVAMPGMSGIELQERLAGRGVRLPVVFLTGYGEVPSAVRAMKGGAIEFLEQPAAGAVVLDAVRRALDLDATRGEDGAAAETYRQRASRLTARERQVLALAARGRSNKEIGRELGISHRTVEIHRGRGMRKLGLRNPVDLFEAVSICDLEWDQLPS
jgi:two-component system, LuxR family, response regulator FixJ